MDCFIQECNRDMTSQECYAVQPLHSKKHVDISILVCLGLKQSRSTSTDKIQTWYVFPESLLAVFLSKTTQKNTLTVQPIRVCMNQKTLFHASMPDIINVVRIVYIYLLYFVCVLQRLKCLCSKHIRFLHHLLQVIFSKPLQSKWQESGITISVAYTNEPVCRSYRERKVDIQIDR